MRSTRKITCEEASRLISAGLDRELSGPARTNLRLHLMVCTACQRFERQMGVLRTALRGMQVGDGDDDEPPAPGNRR